MSEMEREGVKSLNGEGSDVAPAPEKRELAVAEMESRLE